MSCRGWGEGGQDLHFHLEDSFSCLLGDRWGSYFNLRRFSGRNLAPPFGNRSGRFGPWRVWTLVVVSDAASSPFISFFSLPLPAPVFACSMWLCQQVLDDPNEDHLYMGKTRSLAFCHPCSGGCDYQRPGRLWRQPLALSSPSKDCFSFPISAGPHSLKQEGEGSSCWDFLYLHVLFTHSQMFIEKLLYAGYCSRHEGCRDE